MTEVIAKKFFFSFHNLSGKNVLKKPELEKVLQQRKEAQRIKEWEWTKMCKQKNKPGAHVGGEEKSTFTGKWWQITRKENSRLSRCFLFFLNKY